MPEKQLSFTPEEIEMNRAGQITPSQARMLRRSLGRYEGSMLVITLLFFPGLMVFSSQWSHYWLSQGCFSILFLAGLVYLIDFQRTLWRDARQGRCVEVVGRVRMIVRDGRHSSNEIRINDIDANNYAIIINRQQLSQFSEDSCYRFFYAPNSCILLSAEKVDCLP